MLSIWDTICVAWKEIWEKDRDDETCCADAESVINRGKLGDVICCDGRWVPCVYKDRMIEKNPAAQDIIYDCAMRHERGHMGPPDFPIKPKCKHGETVRERNLPDAPIRASECACYLIEQACLQFRIPDCGSDDECKQQVQGRIDFIKQRRNRMGCMPLKDTWLPKRNPEVK